MPKSSKNSGIEPPRNIDVYRLLVPSSYDVDGVLSPSIDAFKEACVEVYGTADPKLLKRAVLRLHPDKNGDNQLFTHWSDAVNAARDLLSVGITNLSTEPAAFEEAEIARARVAQRAVGVLMYADFAETPPFPRLEYERKQMLHLGLSKTPDCGDHNADIYGAAVAARMEQSDEAPHVEYVEHEINDGPTELAPSPLDELPTYYDPTPSDEEAAAQGKRERERERASACECECECECEIEQAAEAAPAPAPARKKRKRADSQRDDGIEVERGRWWRGHKPRTMSSVEGSNPNLKFPQMGQPWTSSHLRGLYYSFLAWCQRNRKVKNAGLISEHSLKSNVLPVFYRAIYNPTPYPDQLLDGYEYYFYGNLGMLPDVCRHFGHKKYRTKGINDAGWFHEFWRDLEDNHKHLQPMIRTQEGYTRLSYDLVFNGIDGRHEARKFSIFMRTFYHYAEQWLGPMRMESPALGWQHLVSHQPFLEHLKEYHNVEQRAAAVKATAAIKTPKRQRKCKSEPSVAGACR